MNWWIVVQKHVILKHTTFSNALFFIDVFVCVYSTCWDGNGVTFVIVIKDGRIMDKRQINGCLSLVKHSLNPHAHSLFRSGQVISLLCSSSLTTVIPGLSVVIMRLLLILSFYYSCEVEVAHFLFLQSPKWIVWHITWPCKFIQTALSCLFML